MTEPQSITELSQQLAAKFYNYDSPDFVSTLPCWYKLNDFDEVVEIQVRGLELSRIFSLKKFPNLKSLSLPNNNIRDLGSALFAAMHLEYLDLSSNLLEEIISLKFMHGLKYLNISKNSIKDLSPLYKHLNTNPNFSVYYAGNATIYPPSNGKDFDNRELIKWFDSTWEVAREKIRECREANLTYLDLGNCGLTDLSLFTELFECIHLKELVLSNEWAVYIGGDWDRSTSKNFGLPNNFFYVPKEISKLSKLEKLICGGDWRSNKKNVKWNRWRLRDFKPFTNLNSLKYLNLSNNMLIQISQIDKLENLEVLHLNNNGLIKIKAGDINSQLKEIYLSNNSLYEVEFLNMFPSLQTIDLHSNPIIELRPIRNFIEKLGIYDSKWRLNAISVAKNKRINPDLLIIKQGKEKVLAYFDQEEAEIKINIDPFHNFDIKVILVGNSNVGKSSLMEWLINKRFKKDIPTTHWLDVKSFNKKFKGKDYKIQFFDFGGQEYYHDTHHLFFTSQTVYLLLWDKDSNNFLEKEVDQLQHGGLLKKNVLIQNYPLHYWLDSIRYYSGRRQIYDDEAQILKLVELKDDLKNIENEVNIPSSKDISDAKASTEDPSNILVLQNKIDTKDDIVFLNEAAIIEKYDKIYDFFRFSLQNLRGLEHVENLLYEAIDRIPLTDKLQLGTWQIIKNKIENKSFKSKKAITLETFRRQCNKTILEIPAVLASSAKEKNNVTFSKTDAESFAQYLMDIGLILYFPNEPELKDKVFLNQGDLLKKIHDILLDLDSSKGQFTNQRVQEVLKVTSFTKECSTIIELMESFKIIIKHPVIVGTYIAPLYLPKTPYKTVELFLSSFKNPVYRYIFEGFIHKGLILEFFSKYGSQVLKEADGKPLYYYWREGIIVKDKISEEILLIKFVNGQPGNDNSYIDVFSFTSKHDGIFLNAVVDELDQLTIGRDAKKAVSVNGKDFVPLELLHEFEKKELWQFEYKNKTYRLTDFKIHLKNKAKVKNIFISYSKDDLKLVNTFIKHLATLRQDGKIANWYCTELIAGGKWNEEIKSHFDQSDIICFMVSPNFIKTTYIMEHEVKWAIDRRNTDSNFKIVPIILDFCRWTTTSNNLGDFTALPYTAKPVVDFKNQNMAWYIIVECIRIMIERDIQPQGDEFFAKELPKDIKSIYERIVEGKVDI